MNHDELIDFLKKNLKIEIETNNDSYYTGGDPLFAYYKRVTAKLILSGIEISESSFDIND